MKKVLASGLILVVLSVALAFTLHAGAEKKCEFTKEQSHPYKGYWKAMKDAKIEVTNTDNGVIVKVTSDNPEAVKLIQECWAKCQKGHCAMIPGHGYKKGSAKWEGKHKSGE